jgi:16S rRNA (uracil1498-N3)-methyltransferase
MQPLVPGVVALPASSARYLVRVLRCKVGDAFEAFDPRAGVVAKGAVVSIARGGDEVQVAIDDVAAVEAREPPVVLVQGYPKGDKLGDVVRDATELGASALVPAICNRSVARPGDKKLAARGDRLQSIADEAARQCKRVRSPTVLAPMPWDDALATAEAMAHHRFVAWEESKTPLRDALLAIDDASVGVAFAIGPEGGLEREEVERAEARGWLVRSLGATILRTETAATAILGTWRVLARS